MPDFQKKRKETLDRMRSAEDIRRCSSDWFLCSCKYDYSYGFDWLGLPIIQYPQDIVALQEIIWRVAPDLILETGIARGGSVVFYASMLELLGGDGLVVGVDVEIRAHNRKAIESHRMAHRIALLEGSSTDPGIVGEVHRLAEHSSRVLVVLDSMHTHEHVAQELAAYSPLVGKGSYVVVLDTVIEDMPGFFPDRPWGIGDNPKTAVREFLERNDRFVVDSDIDTKLQVSVAPSGYLRCVKD